MRNSRHRLAVLALPAALGLAASALPLPAAAPPPVRLLRTQQAGDVTYFHVRFDSPAGLTTAGDRQPRLVPQDPRTRNVCTRAGTPGVITPPGFDAPVMPRREGLPQGPAPVVGLEFVGTLYGEGEASFVLLYPTEGRPSRLDRFR